VRQYPDIASGVRSLATAAGPSSQPITERSRAQLGQFFLSVLQEVGRGAMGLQRGVILILFVDEESARLCLMPMNLIYQTSRFLAGLFS
jgi:hypothetical protein